MSQPAVRNLLTFSPTCSLLPYYIISFHPARSTPTLQVWTRRHILSTKPIPAIYLSSFHPSHFQPLGLTCPHKKSTFSDLMTKIKILTIRKVKSLPIPLKKFSNENGLMRHSSQKKKNTQHISQK